MHFHFISLTHWPQHICGFCPMFWLPASSVIQLKNSLKFDRDLSTKLVKWSQASDCCSWEGVSCEEGRVMHLDLSHERISGELNNSSSLFSFKHLKSLDLSYNNFKSVIPARIGNLKNLLYLNFSNAGFEGQIPQEISQLTRLVILDFSSLSFRNPLLKLENPNLRMLVQNLSELSELYLDHVNKSASGHEWCQALSSSLPNLSVLSLSNCDLSGPIDQSLLKLQSLSVIRLDNNNLSSPVPRFFANFSKLSSLQLNSCELYAMFPKEIFQVPTLQTLDVSNNELLQGFLPEISRQNTLQRLLLRSTDFSGTLPI